MPREDDRLKLPLRSLVPEEGMTLRRLARGEINQTAIWRLHHRMGD